MIQDLTEKIRAWAIFRGLDAADPVKQMLKLVEEMGELGEGMAKNRPDDVKDAIGDMYVVLTILAMQCDTSMEECVMVAYNEIKDRKGKLVNGMFIKESDLVE